MFEKMFKGEMFMSKKTVALFVVGLMALMLVVGGCGGSESKKEVSLVVGKEATVKVPSYMANDEATAKKMLEYLQVDNEPILGKMMLDKVIDGLEEGAKVKVVSQQGALVKVNYNGKDIYVWVNHLKQ